MLLWAVKFALQPRPSRKLTPLFSSDPRFSRFSRKTGLATPLESALTHTPSAKFFRIRTCKKHGGRGTYSPFVTRLPNGNSVGVCGGGVAAASTLGDRR